MRTVADADFVRRQNRGLVLSVLRRLGPMPRTRLAAATGLSPASISGISNELIGQGMLAEGVPVAGQGTRGRPPVEVRFNRGACDAVIVEVDVNRVRCSLVDYAGTLIDRTEVPVTPELFRELRPAAFLIDRVRQLLSRNPERDAAIRCIAVSAQGILDPSGDRLAWSPIAHLSAESIVAPVRAAFGAQTILHKRGRLLAEGSRHLHPELGSQPLAAVFLGSTVAMGLSFGPPGAAGEAGATEFGHMNHVPGGALCRCGMRGCIEAYAADYGVLRAAYGVPDRTPPAAAVPPAAYQELIGLARGGRRNVLHAFHLAGRAIGFGLGRLLTIAPPAHVVIAGPGATAFDLMRGEIEAALRESLVARVNGPPRLIVHHDEREPIFQGLLQSTLETLDREFAASLAGEGRATVRVGEGG